ncbi:MAG: response regulator transcription factor [Candidatus Eremiobacteraeota bacterium]|nr:response regulator transcription factor [Candidatus Eremiobacteraeota bacterium]
MDDGLSAPQIAHQTGRSVHTIRVHVKAIISKFGVSGRNAALSFARKNGLLSTAERHEYPIRGKRPTLRSARFGHGANH